MYYILLHQILLYVYLPRYLEAILKIYKESVNYNVPGSNSFKNKS